MRTIVVGFMVLALVFVVGTLLTPRSVIEANRSAAAEQEKVEKQENAVRQAERDAHNRRVMGCVPEGAENLNPKIFSAMVDDCDREALVQAAHEESEEARMKEKWSAPPLYSDEEFAAGEEQLPSVSAKESQR